MTDVHRLLAFLPAIVALVSPLALASGYSEPRETVFSGNVAVAGAVAGAGYCDPHASLPSSQTWCPVQGVGQAVFDIASAFPSATYVAGTCEFYFPQPVPGTRLFCGSDRDDDGAITNLDPFDNDGTHDHGTSPTMDDQIGYGIAPPSAGAVSVTLSVCFTHDADDSLAGVGSGHDFDEIVAFWATDASNPPDAGLVADVALTLDATSTPCAAQREDSLPPVYHVVNKAGSGGGRGGTTVRTLFPSPYWGGTCTGHLDAACTKEPWTLAGVTDLCPAYVGDADRDGVDEAVLPELLCVNV